MDKGAAKFAVTWSRGIGCMARGPKYSCPRCLSIFCRALRFCPTDGGPLVEFVDDSLIGQSLDGRYFIESCIGDGGMGRVYRARHQRMNKHFAIKILYGDLVHAREMRQRFAHEADAISRMAHDNVASVADFGRTRAGLVYLVMDYAPGETLQAIIAREAPLPVSLVRQLASGIAAGLAHIHERGIIHRDIKPDNVIVSGTAPLVHPRIIDFGAAIDAESREVEGNGEGRLTAEGTVIGTPRYMAPEQLAGRQVGPQSDLYSLGLIMFEMLWGYLPQDVYGSEARFLSVPPSTRQAVDPHLEAIIRSLLRLHPDQRPTCAEEVEVALELACRAGSHGQAPSAHVPGHTGSHDTVETECFDLDEETRVSQTRNLPTMARYRRPRTTGESRS